VIYWAVGISLGAFFVGYILGLDRGFRNAHKQIVMSQLKSAKKKLKPSAAYKPPTDGRKLRLVKLNEDTRE